MGQAISRLFCYFCKHQVQPETPLSQIAPGDYCVCPHCGALWVYDVDLSFIPPTWDDIQELDADTLYAIIEKQQEVFASGTSPLFEAIQQSFEQVKTAYKRHTFN